MPDKFKNRSFESELLDAPGIPVDLLEKNLRELDFINRVMGGHTISIDGLRKLITQKDKIYNIVDLGCGSGDTLQYISRWAKAGGFKVRLTGVDRNADVIHYMNQYCKDYPDITGVVSDFGEFLKTKTDIDIIHCSLFCHHLNDDQLFELFTYIKNFVHTGFVLNDLQRSAVAYYGVYAITHLLNGSSLSKNDGPISVLRAFKKNELQELLYKSGILNYSITWKWAFRYLVIGHSSL